MVSFRAQPPHAIGAGQLRGVNPNPHGVTEGMVVTSTVDPSLRKCVQKIAGTSAWLVGEKNSRNLGTLKPLLKK